jgi:hypothetical protein
MPSGVYPHKGNRRGVRLSKEVKLKMSISHIGNKHTPDTCKKMSLSKADEKHPGWLGENARYGAKHQWIHRKLGKPKYCEICKRTDKKMYHWANKDHKYSRKVGDYMRLCVLCHRKYDTKNNGYVKKRRGRNKNLSKIRAV